VQPEQARLGAQHRPFAPPAGRLQARVLADLLEQRFDRAAAPSAGRVAQRPVHAATISVGGSSTPVVKKYSSRCVPVGS
jgi:hypothetical protein